MRVLSIPYNTWLQVVDNNSFTVYHINIGSECFISWAGDKDLIYKTEVDADSFEHYSSSFLQNTMVVEGEDDAIANIIGLSNHLVKRAPDGKELISLWPTEGKRKTIVTPNWCDETTWYYNSERIVSSSLLVVTPGTEYCCEETTVDAFHGKITGEESLFDVDGNSYRTHVVVDGVVMSEDNPEDEDDGDYWLDYTSGIVHFHSQIEESSDVIMTYHAVRGSEFIFAPTEGKSLKIKDVEVQFSDDIILNDTTEFAAYGYADVFAPHLVPDVIPSGTKIQISITSYKTMMDFINEANGSLPITPKIGGIGWRGISSEIIVFPWKYQAMTDLINSAGMEIRIRLRHDRQFYGNVAVATFYCLVENE